MSRRSAQNERYRKDANIGSTKKSASSAKPKRPAADSTSSSSSASKSSKDSTKKKGLLLPNPATPEFRRWNMFNYFALGTALAAAIAVLVFGQKAQGTPVYWVLWGLWGVSLAASMYIQIKIIRPMRVDWERSGAALAKARQLEDDKTAREAERQTAKDDAAKAKAAPKASSGPRPDDAAKVEFKDEK